jgi:hypothetical protein
MGRAAGMANHFSSQNWPARKHDGCFLQQGNLSDNQRRPRPTLTAAVVLGAAAGEHDERRA